MNKNKRMIRLIFHRIEFSIKKQLNSKIYLTFCTIETCPTRKAGAVVAVEQVIAVTIDAREIQNYTLVDVFINK